MAERDSAEAGGAQTPLENIKKEIEALSADELDCLRRWFREIDADAWDRRFIEDMKSGLLDEAAREALAAHRGGESSRL